jgi:hypothetical protein
VLVAGRRGSWRGRPHSAVDEVHRSWRPSTRWPPWWPGLATGAPVGGRVEVGRPEALGVDAWGRRLFAATGDERTVIGEPQARYFGTDLHGGELTPGDCARTGMIDFETSFATHPQGARR